MSMWWLVYEDDVAGVCVAIEEAASLVSARLKVDLAHHVDAHFVEGHELHKAMRKVALANSGRLIGIGEAHALLKQLAAVA